MRGLVATIRRPEIQSRLQQAGLIALGIDLALALDVLALTMMGGW